MKTEFRNGSHAIRELPSQVLAVATVSKVPQLINGHVYVPMSTTTAGEPVALAYEGEADFDKVAAQAWAIGVPLYWDDTAKNVTSTAGGNTLIGNAGQAQLAADVRGYVIFNSFKLL